MSDDDRVSVIDPLGCNKAHPEYPELAINKLSPDLQVQMAQLALAGYRFCCCSALTPTADRWWTVKMPNGKHLSASGGLDLRVVIRRVAEHHAKVYRDGNEGRNVR